MNALELERGLPAKCHCGCGQPVPVSAYTHTKRGWRKGEPRRFIHGHNRRLKGELYRLEDRGYATPCWIWSGSCNREGYAQTSLNHKTFHVHVGNYVQRFGLIPANRELDHLCRQRACVNPDHLEPVPHKVNMQRGKNARLDQEKVDQIRRLAASGKSQVEIAATFGVSRRHVSDVIAGRRWPLD